MVRRWCALAFVVTVAAALGSCGKTTDWECSVTALDNGRTVPLAQDSNQKWGPEFIGTVLGESAGSDTAAELACETSVQKNLDPSASLTGISCNCTMTTKTTSHSPLVPSLRR
jgi:hypothetical protein